MQTNILIDVVLSVFSHVYIRNQKKRSIQPQFIHHSGLEFRFGIAATAQNLIEPCIYDEVNSHNYRDLITF